MVPVVPSSHPPSSTRESSRRAGLPFPTSLCHRCAAPPEYVRTRTSIFIRCPLLPEKYPRQPVLQCPLFRPAKEDLAERNPLGPEPEAGG